MLANLIEQVSTENRGGLGAVVVFAAGNDDRELKDDEVEALPTVLCVSATDSYGNPTNYTNYGDPIDVAAPSATVSIAPGNTVITNFGGTSAASPVVAGLAGWILSANPALSAAEVRDLIESTAVQSPLVIPDDQGRSTYYGWGSISPPTILAALFPEQAAETPEASGCACSSAPGLASGAAASLLVFLGLGAAVLRRRSS
jgi:subtilisin family serine protease